MVVGDGLEARRPTGRPQQPVAGADVADADAGVVAALLTVQVFGAAERRLHQHAARRQRAAPLARRRRRWAQTGVLIGEKIDKRIIFR